MQETRVWSLDWEDPLEKEIATHFSILALEIPWTEEPGRLQSMGSKNSLTQLTNIWSLSYIAKERKGEKWELKFLEEQLTSQFQNYLEKV